VNVASKRGKMKLHDTSKKIDEFVKHTSNRGLKMFLCLLSLNFDHPSWFLS